MEGEKQKSWTVSEGREFGGGGTGDACDDLEEALEGLSGSYNPLS